MCCKKNTSDGRAIAHAIYLFTHKLYGIKNPMYILFYKRNKIQKKKREKRKRNKIITYFNQSNETLTF